MRVSRDVLVSCRPGNPVTQFLPPELARIGAEFAKFVAAHAKTDAVIEKLHAGQNEAHMHARADANASGEAKAHGDVHARNDAHVHGGAQARGEAHARSGAHKGTAGGDASGDARAHGKWRRECHLGEEDADSKDLRQHRR